MSKGYFASTYCIKELKTFCDHGDIAVEFETGKKSRVVKVIISPDFPEELQDPRIRRTDGYRFYAEDGDGKKRRFMWTPEGVTDNGYWGAVERLAQEVAEVLTRMAGRRPPCPVPPTGQAIYLAEVTDDLEDVRSQIKSALTQQGIQVLPELRLPSQSGALKDEILANGAGPDAYEVVDRLWREAGEQRPDADVLQRMTYTYKPLHGTTSVGRSIKPTASQIHYCRTKTRELSDSLERQCAASSEPSN